MSNDQHLITKYSAKLKELHNDSVRVATTLMTMAGADPVHVGDGVVFWTFANTGEHATIEDAVKRIGAHPSVYRLVVEYNAISRQMIAAERFIASISTANRR